MSEEIKFDHFKDINELLEHINLWYREDDIEYTRWFGLKDLYNLKIYITSLQQKVEQLENIRKEAIEYLESDENIIDKFWKHDFRKYPDYNPFEAKDEEEVRCVELYGYDDLLNILNKGNNYDR